MNNKIKWMIVGACIVIAALVFIILFAPGNKANPILMPADIEKVTIYREGTAGTTFSYTDEEKMDRIVDYLTSLKLQPTSRSPYGPDVFVGGEWQITVLGREGMCGAKIVGDEFFQHPDGTWWLISTEQAGEFEELLKSMTPDEMPDVKLFEEWK